MGVAWEVKGRVCYSWSGYCSIQVNREALMKRYDQGWLMEWTDDVDACLDRVK